jgi:hypothetical protein
MYQKDHKSWSYWSHSRGTGMVQHTLIDELDTAYKQNQGQKHVILLKRCTKSSWQNTTSFHEKSPKKLGLKGRDHHIIKTIYYKPIANIILNGEKLKPFPLKSEMKLGCSLPIFIRQSIGIPSHSNKTR